MAIAYTTAFNSGELSPNMDGRTDLQIYKKGVSHLENFTILPQGGIERRPGTQFIAKTNNGNGSAAARLIPFEFSSDVVYIVEIGNNYARVFDSAGTSYAVSGTVPYLQAEIRDIQFISRFDTLILTHPNHPPQQLQRTSTAPQFAISPIDFIYPPFLDENTTSTTITPSGTLTVGGSATLTASADLFTNTMDDSGKETFIKVRHPREGATKRVTGENKTGSSTSETALDVSFSDWKFETSSSWTGVVKVMRSIDNGVSFDVFAEFDTTGTANKNFIFNSPLTEGPTTLIRVDYSSIAEVDSSGGMDYQISAETIYSEGIMKVTGFTSATVVTGTIVSKIISTDATKDWSLSAFSVDNGFPRTSAFFQNRLFFSGTSAEPGTIYGSVSGDFFNNLQGSFGDLAIKRVPNSPEATRFLESKENLFAGTSGSIINVSPASTTDEIVTATNIKTIPENAFGSSTMQGFLAGNAVLYTQKDNFKIRELIFNSQTASFQSNDLNILSDVILEGSDNIGVVETFLQKQPNQVFWCVKNDGDIASLLYERNQEVIGWSRLTTNGDIISGAAVSGTSDDSIWLCVNRGTTDSPIYCVEKFKPVRDLDWFVDSGVTATGTNITSVSGLNHLEGKTVQVVADGNFHSEQTVSSGSITIDKQSSTIIAGLKYDSIMRTLPIEPTLAQRLPNSRVKGLTKAILRFRNTKGAKVGEFNKQLSNLPVLNTSDITGQPINVETGQFKFFIRNDWTNEKILEVKQDLPYPMTVISLALWVDAEGG
jgi:hypothetical protein|tara:strand:+ start:1555 stop:3861 length:2307 start_codon:yes stop_codon:yes gene_type:complete